MSSNSLDFLLNLRANAEGFNKGVDGAKFAVNALVGAMAALGLGLGVKELAEAADSYAMLSAKIQQSTKDTGNFTQAMAGVHQTALSTNSSLDATAGLFTKLNTVAKDMGKSQQFALDMTSTVTKAIQLGGGSAQASEAAVQQFIQAMQGGVLRGEEFNSIMENGYGLAEALAKGLGVTTGELRKMAENGELSAERVLAALAKQKAGVDAQYSEMPLTISNALQKIATSWQILIGEMDQANGASATVAKALSTIADNLDILKVFFDDVANGVGWFRNQLSEIDPSTIDAIRSALSQAYDTVKVLIANVAEFGTTVWSAFNSALDVISPVFSAFLSGGEDVSGLTTLMNVLRMAMAAVSDIAFSLNVGFKTLLAGIQFLSAGLYSLSAQVMDFIGLDALAQQVQNSSDKMFAQAEKNMSEVNKLTQDHKWSILETYNEIGKTQEQKNAERVANNLKTLADLKAQEAQHVTDYKAISDERIKLQQQLVDARKAGDQSAIDAALAGLAELDKQEKAYQAESKKIIDAKIAAAQAVAEATIRSADAAGQAELKALNAKLAAQGLKAEFDSTGKVVVSAMDGAANATEKVGTTAEQSATKVRKAASALDIDLDAALNRVSNKFTETERSVNDLSTELEKTGVKGKEASEVIYLGWSKWLATAKSQAEIDVAKAKFQEFQDKGVFSTKQVELGMLAIKQATAKLPDDLDEVGKAFERLGVKTKEQLKLAADSAIADFNTMKASGQATSDGLKQAYERVMQAAAASGNQAVIASANAQGASVGLQAQIDETGKSSVKTTQDIVDGLYNVGKTASGAAADGFRELGRVAREEAKTSLEEWEDAMKKIDVERKAQSASNSKGLSELQGGIDQMAEDYYKRLVAAGMNASQARSKADKAKYSLAVETTTALKGGTTLGLNTTKQEMEKTLAYWEKTSSSASMSVGANTNTQNIQAPIIASQKMPSVDTNPTNTVNYSFNFNGKSVNLTGDSSQKDLLNDFFNELEQNKKAM